MTAAACATEPTAGPSAWSPASPDAPPPDVPLTLDLTPGILGGTFTADVGDADPGEPVHLVMSLYGSAPGSCHRSSAGSAWT